MKQFIRQYPAECVFSILFSIVSVWLNLRFTEGANINRIITGHDEYLTVREVYSILEPLSFKHFILAVMGGDVLYYGRVVFYTDALFAWIPYRIWGLEGMVFSIRMAHALWLLAGLLVFSHTFLDALKSKILFLAGSFSLMYTLYFISMPKPEPIQLFMLAMFFRGLKRNAKPVHYIWIGLAYAAKFNILVILPVLFILPVFDSSIPGFLNRAIKALKSIPFFLAGVLAGIPCLILSPFRPVFLKTYLHETIFGSGKSYDNPDLSLTEWIGSGLGGHYFGSHYAGYAFLGLTIAATAYSFFRKSNGIRHNHTAVLLLCGLILQVSVMLISKRLWPHYLWTGTIISGLGLLAQFSKNNISQMHSGGLRLTVLFYVLSGFSFYSKFLPEHISSVTDHKLEQLKQVSENMYAYIEHNYAGRQIGIDGTVYYPYRYFVRASPYHPFAGERPESSETSVKWYADNPQDIWNSSEVIVFYQNHPEKLIRKDQPYLQKQGTMEIYKRFIRETESRFTKDTTFGEMIVYRRITQ